MNEMYPHGVFAKGILDNPSQIPGFTDPRTQIATRPLIEAKGARSYDVFGDIPSALQLEREVTWLQSLDVGSDQLSSPTWFEFPGLGIDWLINRSTFTYGPTEVKRHWHEAIDGINNAAAYLSPPPQYGNKLTTLVPTWECIASQCRDDVGIQFFREWLFINRSSIRKSPGAFAREGGILWELSQMELAHSIAMDRAFCQKYATPLARPEEWCARINQPLRLLYNDGAPRHPSFVSGHAACAGAAAHYILANCNLSNDQIAEVISLAELTFLGRWAAGIHWQADGLAGLHGGWEIARMMAGSTMGNPWAERFAAYSSGSVSP
jgi:hypothetical protein